MKKIMILFVALASSPVVSMGISNAGPVQFENGSRVMVDGVSGAFNNFFTPGSVIEGQIWGDLSNQTMTGITFKDVDFRLVNLSNATFRNCNFTYSQGFHVSYPFADANLNGAVFQDCNGINPYKLVGAKKGYTIGTGMWDRTLVTQNGAKHYTNIKPIWKGIGIGCAVLGLVIALKNYKTVKAWVKKKMGFTQEKAQATTPVAQI